MENRVYSRIIGTGSAVPPKVLTNHDLEKIVDTSDQWIVERTGISERHVTDEATAASDLAIEASKKALDMAGITAEEVDLILVATVTPDMFFPSTGCVLHKALTSKPIPAFDLSAACSGYIYGLSIADAYIRSGMARTVLLVGTDTLCKMLDWTDRNSCVLFGDGAGATVLRADSTPGVLKVNISADGTYGDLLQLPGGGSRNPCSQKMLDEGLQYVRIKGREVYKTAVRVMSQSVEEILKELNLTGDDLDLFIPHQANLRIIEAVAAKLNYPMEKTIVNIDRYGNTTAATIPIAIDEVVRDGRMKKGDTMAMVAFGGGFTWGASVLKY